MLSRLLQRSKMHIAMMDVFSSAGTVDIHTVFNKFLTNWLGWLDDGCLDSGRCAGICVTEGRTADWGHPRYPYRRVDG
jgi:hypothetical protein